jgi:hypothetical protein
VPEILVNNAMSQLNGAVDGSTDPVTFAVDSATTFPATGNFTIIIDGEIMLVTSVSGNNFTADRAQEGTAIASHLDNASVASVLTAGSLERVIQQASLRPYSYFAPTGVDDEFDNNSFSGWTAVGTTPVPTVTEENSIMSIYHPGGDAAARLYAWMKSDTIGAGDYIEICFRAVSGGDNYPIIGVAFANGATAGSGTQVVYYFSIQENQVWLNRFTGYNTVASSSQINVNATQPMSHMFLRLVHNGSNSWSAFYSPDGISWIRSHNAVSHTMTPTHVGIVCSKWGGSIPAVFSVEYFKKR